MEEVLKKLEGLERNIEDIRSTMATKADLERFATKTDIQELSARIDKVIDTKVSIIELPDRLRELGVLR